MEISNLNNDLFVNDGFKKIEVEIIWFENPQYEIKKHNSALFDENCIKINEKCVIADN